MKNFNFLSKQNFKQKIKKDRKKIHFTNKKKKYFKKRKKQLSLNFDHFKCINKIIKNKKIIFFLFFIIIIILGGGSIFSPYTKIKNINIIKKDDITNINIAYSSVKDIRGKSIFNINKKKIKEKLIQYQSNIKNIDLKIKLPNSIKINLESYKAIFYTKIKLNNIEKKYLILSNGTLVPSSKVNKELKELKIITNNNLKLPNFLDYKNIYSQKYINNIEQINLKLKENIVDIKIEELTYYTIERELHIKTNNLILIFSIEEDINNQIEKLVIFNKDYKNISKKPIYYIDLRIKDKIFYCPQEEAKICKKNLDLIY